MAVGKLHYQAARILYELTNCNGMSSHDLMVKLDIPGPSVRRILNGLKQLKIVYKNKKWHYNKRQS